MNNPRAAQFLPDVVVADSRRIATDSFVNPLARAMTVLSAFSPHERWLGPQEISVRTAIPISSAIRFLRSMSSLGYIKYCGEKKKYRLTASVLSLGYAAIAHSDIQSRALPGMQALADEHETYVVLGTRDRLDLVLLECCSSRSDHASRGRVSLSISTGTRLEIAESPLGWALLASLPELERNYLSMKIEQRKKRDWQRISRRFSEAFYQVQQKGYCTSLGEVDPEISVVAAPLLISGCVPMVIACIGASVNMTRARIDRELGPKLIQLERRLIQEISFE
jgi:DNA-binding IclR family transcriptional regulator